MHLYEIRKCEDTGRLALYRRIEHGNHQAWALVEHESNLWEMFSCLSKHFTELSKRVSPDQE